SSRECIRKTLPNVSNSEFFQQCFKPLPPFPAREWQGFENRHNIGLNRQLAEYRCFLREIADSILSPQIHREIRDVVLSKQHRTRIRTRQSNNHVKGCRLARSIGS